jgi:hypothetical protein
MKQVAHVRPCADGIGYILEIASQRLWFSDEVYAINYVHDRGLDCDVVVLNKNSEVQHCYRSVGQPADGQRRIH